MQLKRYIGLLIFLLLVKGKCNKQNGIGYEDLENPTSQKGNDKNGSQDKDPCNNSNKGSSNIPFNTVTQADVTAFKAELKAKNLKTVNWKIGLKDISATDGKTPGIYTGNMLIDTSGIFLTAFKIDKISKKTVLVNASNSGISFGGAGLNGGITSYAVSEGAGGAYTDVGRGKTKDWLNLVLPKSGCNANAICAGEFAISDFKYGKIYHACGPIGCTTDNINILKSNQQKVTDLYYNMLKESYENGIKKIVLGAVSVSTFANYGADYTKDEFIAAMFNAIYEGIKKFTDTFSTHGMVIICNSWVELKPLP